MTSTLGHPGVISFTSKSETLILLTFFTAGHLQRPTMGIPAEESSHMSPNHTKSQVFTRNHTSTHPDRAPHKLQLQKPAGKQHFSVRETLGFFSSSSVTSPTKIRPEEGRVWRQRSEAPLLYQGVEWVFPQSTLFPVRPDPKSETGNSTFHTRRTRVSSALSYEIKLFICTELNGRGNKRDHHKPNKSLWADFPYKVLFPLTSCRTQNKQTLMNKLLMHFYLTHL